MDDIRTGTCPLCRHNEIVVTLPKIPVAMNLDEPIAAHRRTEKATWGDRRLTSGTLSLHVCRRCGYAQWFAQKPDQIPIGEEYETRVVKGAEPAGPFR